MTFYMYSPEVHAQIIKAPEYSTPIAEFDDMQSEATAQIEHNTALAMLKAMKPVEHIAELMWDEEREKSYMQYTLPIGLLLQGSKLYAKEQQ